MKAPPEDAPVLARGAYRRRRLADAARILPFVGAFLFLLPAFWSDEAAIGTARGGIYVFAAWAGLIGAAAALARLLARETGDDGAGDG